ncbi:MAG: hypothetical protein ACRERV_13235 [Methylococcales bacterium]
MMVVKGELNFITVRAPALTYPEAKEWRALYLEARAMFTACC